MSGKPAFASDAEYRIAQRKPQAGEVWELNGQAGLATSDGFTRLSDGRTCEGLDPNSEQHLLGKTTIYAAPSVESYYASKLYKRSLAQDSGFEYDDANKLLAIVKKAAGVE